jgi:hypothetical protein
MQLMKQPNRWSCLTTSFAMVLNITYDELIKEIGHDGSKLMWPDLPDPMCRQSFHIQELILCCYRRGLAVIPFEIYPIAGPSPHPQIREIESLLSKSIIKKSITVTELKRLLAMIKGLNDNVYKVLYPEDNEKIFDQLLSYNKGVMTGESLLGGAHAVAWDGKMIYDPSGVIRPIQEFIVDTFYMIRELK